MGTRTLLLGSMLLATPSYGGEEEQYVCSIGGVYENVGGKLVPRLNDKAIGEHIYVNADTGEVTGYFGTDGFEIRKMRRPDDDGLLTVETATGFLGDAANWLRVAPADENNETHTFVYTKNWLIISGECSAVRRHR